MNLVRLTANLKSLILLLFAGANNTNAINAQVRLTNGASQFEGRVEVYYDGQWGAVCADNWGIVDAK